MSDGSLICFALLNNYVFFSRQCSDAICFDPELIGFPAVLVFQLLYPHIKNSLLLTTYDDLGIEELG